MSRQTRIEQIARTATLVSPIDIGVWGIAPALTPANGVLIAPADLTWLLEIARSTAPPAGDTAREPLAEVSDPEAPAEDGPECDTCGSAMCPDASLPEFSEPQACSLLALYNALRYDRCEYGCGRDITKETIRRDIVPVFDQAMAAREAKAAYFAMWRFFLRLPSPTPLSDAVQREAMRLRDLEVPETGGSPDVGRPEVF